MSRLKLFIRQSVKYYHNFNLIVAQYLPNKPTTLLRMVGLLLCLMAFIFISYLRLSAHASINHRLPYTVIVSRPEQLNKTILSPLPLLSDSGPVFAHHGITTTVFWVGETAGLDNGHISNYASTWDGQWDTHFGGIDNPDKRNGYLPAGFTPRENPFYVALPYSDLTNKGVRKKTAISCPLRIALKDRPYSWCKNSWIAIRHGEDISYAQWEDAGPFGEDDSAYVFGGTTPHTSVGERAGLDVSPAIQYQLKLPDVSTCDWTFIASDQVPNGPWKHIITTSLGDSFE